MRPQHLHQEMLHGILEMLDDTSVSKSAMVGCEHGLGCVCCIVCRILPSVDR